VSGARPPLWRGSVSRLEGFSDAVFAFAVTLLVVSLEVPHSFDELMITMRGFPAFGVCFALLVMIWHNHRKFFERYPLEDTLSVALNAALLFVVLFYVYPLKFLFTALFDMLFPPQGSAPLAFIASRDMRSLMVIYGLGYLSVFGLFVALHLRAVRMRASLGLDDPDVYDAYSGLQHCGLHVGVALLSIAIVMTGGPERGFWAGISYGLVGPAAGAHAAWRARRRAKRFSASAEGAP
jgi:hypothetical protein